jgi:glycine cleavage system aminomethyltransferase T
MTDLKKPTEVSFPHSPFVPYDRIGVSLYNCDGRPFAVPYEYTGWRDEQLSWKKTCYIHGNLNPSPTYRIHGREAVKFLSDHLVNTFANFPVGTGKHGIMCTEEGLNMMDGVIIRVDEDDFITYWMAPYIAYALEKGKYDATGESLTGKVFLFQVGGPRALEVLETATGECLHDIKFMHHRLSSVDGREVRVLRVGMAGSLAYELHGRFEDAWPVYSAVFKAGEKYGIRKLGLRTYMMNHTENGFPQAYYHFFYPWGEDKGFAEWMSKQGPQWAWPPRLAGSMGPDLRLRYRNPVELGWAGMIKFDHDFVGRAALEKEVAHPRRKMVTLVWNPEDILDVHASQFQPGEPYLPIDSPSQIYFTEGDSRRYWADQVLKDGKLVGISSGRAYSYYYRQMLSLSSIDVKHGDLGNEVIVLWGNPGTRQKEIRATVSRFPYFNENRNEVLDVSQIPCVAAKAK